MTSPDLTARTVRCPDCGATAATTDRYCESCGQALHDRPVSPPVAPAGATTGWVSSTSVPGRCPTCGGDAAGTDGTCGTCGQRRPVGDDRAALDLGLVAGVTDIGRRHQRNEDAMAIGRLPGTALAVICDGVSSSSRGDTAAHAAVDAGMPALLAGLSAGAPTGHVTETAAAAARTAVIEASASVTGNPPSCTYVSAVVTASTITIGWIGDSRAYWLPFGAEPTCLTIDDSLAAELIATGVPPAEAYANPQAGALVRWLGVDADDGPARTVTIAPTGPGRVVVCSDGLSRYRPAPTDLAAATPPGAPLPTAQHLVRLALDAGGVDNITVVVIPFPPAPPATGTGPVAPQPTYPPGWRPPTLPATPRPPEWR